MILTLDVGNSNIVSILYNLEGEKLYHDRQETIKLPDYHDYCDFFRGLLKAMGGQRITAVSISCVVPPITQVISQVVSDLLPKVALYVVSVDKVPNLTIRLDDPRELGADLIATTYGAYAKYKQPTIICDLGSATKITLVSEGELFHGGVIMPGMSFMAKSLHRMIPHLPDIELKRPEKILGRNTVECIQSGIIRGSLASVMEIARELEEEIGEKCTWIMTGGLSNIFSEEEIGDYKMDPDLLSDGIFYLTKEWMDDEGR